MATLSLMGLALALVGELDEAARVGIVSFSIATTTKSARTIKELVHLLDRLSPWLNHTSVREFRDMLLTLIPVPWLLDR